MFSEPLAAAECGAAVQGGAIGPPTAHSSSAEFAEPLAAVECGAAVQGGADGPPTAAGAADPGGEIAAEPYKGAASRETAPAAAVPLASQK